MSYSNTCFNARELIPRIFIFLLYLRHVHAQRAANKFETLREEFVERLRDNDPRLEWTLEQQREELEEQLDDLEARQKAAFRAFKAIGARAFCTRREEATLWRWQRYTNNLCMNFSVP